VKTVLIDPPTSHDQIYGDWDLSAVDTYCPPLGLLHIASFIRQNEHEPHVLDLTARKWSSTETLEFIFQINPGIVGISAKTININNAAALAQRLRQAGYSNPIVIGGAHVTAVPSATLELFPQFDLGVLGEGEETFLEIVTRVEQCASLTDIEGTVIRNDDGRVRANPRRPPIEDLDRLPLPAWDLLENFPHGYQHSALETKQLPAASIITSRGCPFSCTFCDNAVFGQKVRHHSAGYTLDMISHLKTNFGVRDLMILDDNFLLKKERLFEICESLAAEKDKMSWYCMGHSNSMTRDRLDAIKSAGCWFIELGIESGCDRILKVLKKSTNKEKIAKAVRLARNAGLKVKGNFIFGLPTETTESLNETIEFAVSVGLTHFQQNFLTVWPGCAISDVAEDYGEHTGDWETMAHQRITFVPHGLTESDLVSASKRAFRRFYLRPSVMAQFAMSLTSPRAVVSTWKAFLVFLQTVFRRNPRTAPNQRLKLSN